MDYERTSTIDRAEGGAAGRLSGILVSDGEASDGHILDIAGGDLPKRAPLLFGHDDVSGSSNLGSWDSFEKIPLKKGAAIRGTAQIEQDGQGVQQEWRDDIALMIQKKHINQFSVRWSETGDPIPRINLPSDHPAFVDAQKEKSSRKRWGLFFPKWRLLEGSVVTLGADPNALIGRMNACSEGLRPFYRGMVNEHLLGRADTPNDLVALQIPDGTFVYVERAAHDAMLGLANERLGIALDLHEIAAGSTTTITIANDDPDGTNDADPDDTDDTDQDDRDDSSESDQDPETDEPSVDDARSQLADFLGDIDTEGKVEELLAAFADALDRSEQRTLDGVQQLVDAATGRVT
jgi:hypothetical protein